MSDKFNEAFGLPDDEPESNKALDVFHPPVENSEEDFQYARQNLYTTIELASKALDELASFAAKAQNARTYEVLANLVRTTIDANKDLLELQKKRKDLQKDGGTGSSSGPQTINNNLFMTTAEFQKYLENQEKNKNERNRK